MCGIFAYKGQDMDSIEKVVNGLKRLEYRGYDSWGYAYLIDDELSLKKHVGEIDTNLDDAFESQTAISHTRWATHGGVTEVNAHPHMSSDNRFALVQNGIVENYQSLKQMLIKKGFEFRSETDTEVIVRLIELELKSTEKIETAIMNAFSKLDGRNTILVIDSETEELYGIRNGSPMVLGIDGEDYYLASDILSFSEHTNKVVYIDDLQLINISSEGAILKDLEKDKEIEYEIKEVDVEKTNIDKGGFDHFMLKEIYDQNHTISSAVQYSEAEMKELLDLISEAKNVYTVGAGTAAFAAGQVAYYLRSIAGISAVALRSYEVESYREVFDEEDVIIAVSQSGETADTIEALERAQRQGVKVVSLVNMLGSTITRMSEFPFFSRSGPEIGVASTKAFTSQITWGLLLAKSLNGEFHEAKELIKKSQSQLEEFLSSNTEEIIKSWVEKFKDKEHFFVLGKGSNFYVALEGALKIKEITYKHFEGFAAGELKHGVIALIEDGTPVVAIVSDDSAKADMINSIAEVKSRGAETYVIGKEDNELYDNFIQTPDLGELDAVSNVIPFQLISYHLGVELGNSPDKPRNLAKSVTVK